METPSSGARPRRRFFSAADAVFLFAIVAIAPTMITTNLHDPGLGWHIRNIDAMLEAGGWLQIDPFSSTAPGATWYTNQWIGDLALWLGFHWAGWNGVAAIALLVLGFTYRHVFRCLSDDGSPWPAALVWTLAAMFGSYIGWVVRPNLVTPLLLFVTVRACSMFHDDTKSRRQMLALLPLFAFWANTHGGFLSGVLTLVAALGIEACVAVFAFEDEERRPARWRSLFLAMLVVGVVLATMLTPYGWKIYPWTLRLVTSDVALFEEFRAPDFNWGTWKGAARYEFFVLVLPALLGVSRWRPNLVATGLSVLWLHFALQSRRMLPLWVLSVTPLLASASLDLPWINRAVAKAPLSPDFRQLLSRPSAPSSPLLLLLLSAATLAWARFSTPMLLEKGSDAAVRELIAQNDGQAVIFHDANWGGDLILQGWDAQPRFKVWMDDRFDVHGPRLEEYLTIRDARPGWRAEVDRLGIDVIGLAANWPLADRLAGEPGWEALRRDDEAVVYRRRAGNVPTPE